MSQEMPDAGKTDSGVSDVEVNSNFRPAETDLLIDDTAPDNPMANEAGGGALPGIGFGDFARMIIVLGIVIALIYGFFWLLKRFSGVKAEGEDVINLISTRPLKGDAALHLVEVGTHIYVVGSTGSAVNLIAELDDQESLDTIRLQASRTRTAAPGGFAGVLRNRFFPSGSTDDGSKASRATQGAGGAGPAGTNLAGGSTDTSAPASDPGEFVRRQRERLKNL